jgi:hypothetical protein
MTPKDGANKTIAKTTVRFMGDLESKGMLGAVDTS